MEITPSGNHYYIMDGTRRYTIAPFTRQEYRVYSQFEDALFSVYRHNGGWYIHNYRQTTQDLGTLVVNEARRLGYFILDFA